jgi:hypothetical protein
VPGEQGAQPGQLAGQLFSGAWLDGLPEFRYPGERGGAVPLHGVLVGAGEQEADEHQGLLR